MPFVISTVTHKNIYPIQVLNVDTTSFFVNKIFYHFNTSPFSCQVQGSHLIQKKKLQNETFNIYDGEYEVSLVHNLISNSSDSEVVLNLHRCTYSSIWVISRKFTNLHYILGVIVCTK